MAAGGGVMARRGAGVAAAGSGGVCR